MQHNHTLREQIAAVIDEQLQPYLLSALDRAETIDRILVSVAPGAAPQSDITLDPDKAHAQALRLDEQSEDALSGVLDLARLEDLEPEQQQAAVIDAVRAVHYRLASYSYAMLAIDSRLKALVGLGMEALDRMATR